jgi:hypothetical protein
MSDCSVSIEPGRRSEVEPAESLWTMPHKDWRLVQPFSAFRI